MTNSKRPKEGAVIAQAIPVVFKKIKPDVGWRESSPMIVCKNVFGPHGPCVEELDTKPETYLGQKALANPFEDTLTVTEFDVWYVTFEDGNYLELVGDELEFL